MIYEIVVTGLLDNTRFVEATDPLDALQILAKELCVEQFIKNPKLEEVNAFNSDSIIRIKPVQEKLIKK